MASQDHACEHFRGWGVKLSLCVFTRRSLSGTDFSTTLHAGLASITLERTRCAFKSCVVIAMHINAFMIFIYLNIFIRGLNPQGEVAFLFLMICKWGPMLCSVANWEL